MSKKKPISGSKSKKPGDALLKRALATTAANIARIETAERAALAGSEGGADPSGTTVDVHDDVPVTEVISAGSPALKKPNKARKTSPKPKPGKPAKAPKSASREKSKRLSGLDAAAKVLMDAKEPMNAQAIIKAMSEKGLWKSPGGKTPHATIYAAMIRDIKLRGREARFIKKDRGLFAANTK